MPKKFPECIYLVDQGGTLPTWCKFKPVTVGDNAQLYIRADQAVNYVCMSLGAAALSAYPRGGKADEIQLLIEDLAREGEALLGGEHGEV